MYENILSLLCNTVQIRVSTEINFVVIHIRVFLQIIFNFC
jgi:hypothetical protein